MDIIRSLCQWTGLPKDLIAKIFNRKFPKMKDAVIEGNIATVEEYYGLEYPIAGEEENILHIALQHRQMEMAEYILEKMEDINVQDKNSDGDTPLMLATLANNFRLVERLVDMGAPLNSRENQGATPFIAAAANGFIDIVEYLLQKGANPLIRNFKGQTALHRACYYGKMNVILYLIDKSNRSGLKLCKRDRSGNNCLHSAAEGLSINCLRYFTKILQNLQMFDQRNDSGDTVYNILQRQFNLIQQSQYKRITMDDIKKSLRDKNFHLNIVTKKSYSRVLSNRSQTNNIPE